MAPNRSPLSRPRPGPRHATRDTRHGWSNGELVQTAADQARLGKHVDGALLFLTHDIVRSPEALANVVGQLSSGDRVAVMGPKDAAPGLLPVNVVVRALLSRFAGHVDELRDPWDHVERLIPNLRVKPIALGGAYIAWAALGSVP